MRKKSNKLFVLSAYDLNEQKIKKRNDNISDLTDVEKDEIKPTNFVRYLNTWAKDLLSAKKFKTLNGITKFYKEVMSFPIKKDKYGDPFIYEIPIFDWNTSIDNLINLRQTSFDRWKNSQESKKLNP